MLGRDDYYNTDPFGDEEPLSPSVLPSTTRGFYNEEFSPLNLEADCECNEMSTIFFNNFLSA